MTDTPQDQPLWRAMHDAWSSLPGDMREGIATEIRAVADWLVPEEAIEDVPGRFVNGCCHEQRQALRQRLLAEADRAERGGTMSSTQGQPLWRVMNLAYDNSSHPQWEEHHGMAAEIRAVADWIKRRQEFEYGHTLRDVREVLGWLRAEADRAERGDA
jgi:hypothetical protein